MRLDLRKARDFPVRLLCLYLTTIAISLCVITYYRLDDFGKIRSCVVKDSANHAKHKTIAENQSSEHSETIHIAAICGGHDATRGFYVLLKSILFYRVNTRLELHLFVNLVSERILRKLFESWPVPDLGVNYYQTSDYEHEISWIPNRHYSNRFGLLKLVAPTILADLGVKRVLFLDTDMLAQGNIDQLWNKFEHLDASPVSFIGLVENQSDWYLKGDNSILHQDRVAWPALGRGFNTGLLLIDLVKLKRNNWSAMWRDVTEMGLISYHATVLADQDIYNSIIKRHSWIAVPLACHYNLQLNDHTNLSLTCPKHRARTDFKLTHWNSPHKLRTRNEQADYYRSWYTAFIDWDGKLLTRSGCPSTESSADLQDSQPSNRLEMICKDIRPRPHDPLRAFTYFLNFETDLASSFDVTLVVHLSMDRMRALGELASHWAGPMSVALYLSEMETSQFLEFVSTSESLAPRRNIGYHLVFRDCGWNYPINRLRNLALDNAITQYVFIVDVDFLPGFNSYDYLKATIKTMSLEEGQNGLHMRALVVAAFENNEYRFEYPASKAELIRQLDLGTITKFRQAIWPQGQSATDYERWKSATKPYEIEWAPEYEPFIVVEKNVTRFDERFNGFGWNKVEHIMQLAASGYRFSVLPEVFTIHQSHPASYDIVKHRESRKYQACIRMLKLTFLSELLKSHPDFKLKLANQTQELNEKLPEVE